jgi:hypothetical protein
MMTTATPRIDFDSLSIPEILVVLREQKERAEALGKEKAEYEKTVQRIKFDILPERMAQENITNIKTDAGRLHLKNSVSTSTKDAGALREWLEENGFGDLVQPSVSGQTLKAFVLEQMKEHDGSCPIPESIVEVKLYTEAVFTPSKN